MRQFPTPNVLAEALTSKNATLNEAAQKIWPKFDFHRMAGHFLHGLLPTPKNPKGMLDRIFFVGKTVTLDADFREIVRRLGWPVERLDDAKKYGSMHESSIKQNQTAMSDLQTSEHHEKLSDLGMTNVVEKLKTEYTFLHEVFKAGLIDQPCTGPADCNM
jgi:hypothetical protein